MCAEPDLADSIITAHIRWLSDACEARRAGFGFTQPGVGIFMGRNSQIAAPVQGQATLHYFGTNTEKFEELFSAIGRSVVKRRRGAARLRVNHYPA